MAEKYAHSPIYQPDPYQTTMLPNRFPEHHYPLEHARHAVSHVFKDIQHGFKDFHVGEDALINPRVDIHETQSAFYMDVEIPGVRSQDRMTLKWLSERTLLFGAAVERVPIPRNQNTSMLERGKEPTSQATGAEVDHRPSGDGKSGSDSSQDGQPAYLTVGERKIGKYGRAFSFPVDVDHERASVELDAGLLRIVVSKLANKPRVDKDQF